MTRTGTPRRTRAARIAGLAILLAGLAAAPFVWPEPPQAPRTTATTPAPAATDGFAPAAVAAPTATPAPGATPVRVAPAPPAAREARGVQIVDELGRPVADADVAWLPTGESWRWNDEPLQHREQQVRAAGTRALADAAGFVPTPGAATVLVVARRGARYGQRVVDFADGSPVPVAIAPEHTLHALVVDAAGVPQAGVPVAVVHRADAHAAHRPWGEGRFAGVSGPDGRLRIDAVGTLPHWPRHAPRLALRALVLDAPSAVVEFDLAAAPALIQVPCPPFGRAALHVRDADGRPLRTAPRRLELAVWGSAPRALPQAFLAGTEPGAALVGPLALGRQWNLGDPFTEGFDGPRTHGEVVAVQPPLWLGTKVVRLLGPDGAVLRDADVEIGGPTGQRIRGATDADGWLLLRHEWVFHRPLGAFARLGDTRDGETATLRAGVHTPIAIVDAVSGEAVVASLWAEPGAHPFAVFAPDRATANHEVVSERAGLLNVECRAEGYERLVAAVPAGRRDVVLRLQPDGTLALRARVLLDEDLPLGSLDVRLGPATSAGRPAARRSDAPGVVELRWSGLADELHRLEVRLGPGVRPQRVVDGLRAGREAPLAAVVDLRGAAAVATFAGSEGALFLTDGVGWGRHATDEPLLLPKDAQWQGFLDGPGLPVLFPIAPGVNRAEAAPFPVLRVTCPGAGTAFDAADVGIHVHLLRRAEPLLDAAEAGWRAPDEPLPPPRERAALTPAGLAALPAVGTGSGVEHLADATWPIRRRGTYLVVPFLGVRPLLDQAVEVPVDGTAAEVVATVAIDPVRLAAARRAQAEARAEAEAQARAEAEAKERRDDR